MIHLSIANLFRGVRLNRIRPEWDDVAVRAEVSATPPALARGFAVFCDLRRA